MRVGIIGAGGVVSLYHLPVLRAMPEIRVDWLCDLDRHKAAALAGQYGIAAVFDSIERCPDVDAVLIAIPVGVRRSVWEQIFRRRWHVFCEKPLAVSTAELDWILENARHAKLEVGVGLMRRFYAGVMLAERVCRSGALGPVTEVWASEGAWMSGTGRGAQWYQNSPVTAGGGVLMETGAHLVDQVLTISGASDFHLDECSIDWRGELDYQVRVSALVQRDGGTCRLGVALSRTRDLFNGIAINFEHSQLRLSLQPDAEAVLLDRDGQRVAMLGDPAGGQPTPGRPYRAFAAQWRAFVDQCLTRRPGRASAASARLSIAFIEACYRARDGVLSRRAS